MTIQDELSPTWGMALRLWWAITWRGFLLSILPVFLLTIPISIVFMVLEYKVGLNPEFSSNLTQLVGMGIGFAVQIYVIKCMMNKDFSGFQIKVIKS